MQLGSFTVPVLPLVAVLGAGVLVVLVLWGVWRVRRTPAPGPLPLEPPRAAADPQPSSADWTGEVAGGPADPPRPARARTVADVVAERGADTGPLPRVPAYAGAVVASGAGRHAAPDDDGAEGSLEALFAPADEQPDAATLARGRDPEATAAVSLAAASPVPGAASGTGASGAAVEPLPRPRPTPRPRSTGLRRVRDAGTGTDTADPGRASATLRAADPSGVDAAAGADAAVASDAAATAAAATDSAATDAAAASDAAGADDAAPTDTTAARDAAGTPDDPATPRVPEWPVARLRIVDDPTDVVAPGPDATPAAAGQAPAAGDDTVPPAADPAPAAPTDTAAGPLPPWSAERAEPAAEDLPATSGIPAVPPPAPTPPAGSEITSRPTPEPVSRAVQQALAARAVQRARLRATDAVVDPQPDAPGGEQQELPLAVVPTTGARTPAAGDAKDRLLGVLLEDPARAVDATERLDDTRDRIAELDEVLRRRRDDLAGAVRHLHECGLDPAQIGRLSGMAVDEVRTILDGEDAER
ncbi:hypothetical protein ND486_04945 [Pseudonocardia sp. DR1-2]|uniref:hypothetical protein n=1 Tax=Pseudonocardia sp. DR1-2 TaxID=2951168 RepID=UPI002043C407|nr:hypothetical protein [Pseudonocardia sp. DR1-2]MCM3845545.1 hypothetical protein [Pseudonocardia sp. DR1-2]